VCVCVCIQSDACIVDWLCKQLKSN